jgi:hypothetical protein
MTFDAQGFNAKKYEDDWTSLNSALREIESSEGLPAVLRALHHQKLDIGFIQDDLSAVTRWRLRHPDSPDMAFIVQFNPRRAQRTGGAGRAAPPAGARSINGGCFLCRDNIRWQQRGIELGYDLRTDSTSYVAWMNPFPLMPTHITLATTEHEPQSWIGNTTPDSRQRIEKILRDFLEITGRLPGFIGFYNGEGAGATIPDHFHFQFFERPVGREPFPLEHAAAPAHRLAPVVLRRDRYPITTLYFRGDREAIVERAATWVGAWTDVYHNDPTLSANVIAIKDPDSRDSFHLFFVPRNRHYSHGPGMIGTVGGLEVLGELVFSSDVEKQSLDMGRFDYHSARLTLGAVEAPGVEEFLSRL